jgi:oligopeptide/dipeptide ABC transporter ATP-binding protein
MIFQDPFASLDPRMTVAQIVGEPLAAHEPNIPFKEREERVVSILWEVGLDASSLTRYAFEFSGGQRQRIGIARALVLNPSLVVADEPVSALDVSIQAQVINLLAELRKKLDLTYLFIAHDLSVVKHISDRVAVMYLGRIVELAETETLFSDPLHPYTQALLSAAPVPVPGKKGRRIILGGDVPSPLNPPSGCPFHPRCVHAMERCRSDVPRSVEREGHIVACHLHS